MVTTNREIGVVAIAAALAAMSGSAGAILAALLGGAFISGPAALIIWLVMVRVIIVTLSNRHRRDSARRTVLTLALAGSALTSVMAATGGGLPTALTGVLAAGLGLLLVPAVAALLNPDRTRSAALHRKPDPAAEAPEGIGREGYWQVNSALGGSGMWGYGFRRAFNPVTGEAGEWLGPGLVRKNDDTVVRVDRQGRPL